MAFETATIPRPEVAEISHARASTEWLRDAQTQSERSNKWSLTETISLARAIEPNSFTPNFRLTDHDATRKNRADVQDYSAEIRTEWDKIDTRKRGVIDKDDLDRYITDPANAQYRDMARFFRDNYDLVSTLAYDPVKPGNEFFKGYGILKDDINKLESLTDPAKFKSLVKWEAFGSRWAVTAGFGTILVGSGYMATAGMAAETTAALLTVGAVGLTATVGAAFAVGAAAGLGVGYLFYQSKVREHYSAKRAELESRMR